ncbi:MAG: signal recognition particle-docking protein FtsY [Alphaproteobacteria bacterium]|nr:signal recognition particle-docking protein FtsY [Alphaproteobacteria bacterium]
MPEKTSWLRRLQAGLSKSSTKLKDGIGGIFTGAPLDEAMLDELEEVLIRADLGVASATELIAGLKRERFGKDVDAQEVRDALANAIQRILDPVAKPFRIDPEKKPFVVLVVGVNGSGKTTTIGKLAKQLHDEGRQVLLAAADTFRAAAVAQLERWGERAHAPVLAREEGADAAGLAYDALEQARQEKRDVLLIDTAGRLQNKTGLMEELQKIARVLKKVDPTAPHATLLVLDANVGQNAHSQVETFRDMVAVDGLMVTKLDGTARGGVVVALAERFGLPVHAVGVGEAVEDLRPFEARAFARDLLGVEDDR